MELDLVLGVAALWLIHVVVTLPVVVPVVWLSRRSVRWHWWETAVFVMPFAVWLTLFYKDDMPKTLANFGVLPQRRSCLGGRDSSGRCSQHRESSSASAADHRRDSLRSGGVLRNSDVARSVRPNQRMQPTAGRALWHHPGHRRPRLMRGR